MDSEKSENYEFLDLSDVDDSERNQLKQSLFGSRPPDHLQLPWTLEPLSQTQSTTTHQRSPINTPLQPWQQSQPYSGDQQVTLNGTSDAISPPNVSVPPPQSPNNMYTQPPPSMFTMPPPHTTGYLSQHPQNVYVNNVTANLNLHGYVSSFMPAPQTFPMQTSQTQDHDVMRGGGNRGRNRSRNPSRHRAPSVESPPQVNHQPFMSYVPVQSYPPTYYASPAPSHHPSAQHATGSPIYIAPIYHPPHMYGTYHPAGSTLVYPPTGMQVSTEYQFPGDMHNNPMQDVPVEHNGSIIPPYQRPEMSLENITHHQIPQASQNVLTAVIVNSKVEAQIVDIKKTPKQPSIANTQVSVKQNVRATNFDKTKDTGNIAILAPAEKTSFANITQKENIPISSESNGISINILPKPMSKDITTPVSNTSKQVLDTISTDASQNCKPLQNKLDCTPKTLLIQNGSIQLKDKTVDNSRILHNENDQDSSKNTQSNDKNTIILENTTAKSISRDIKLTDKPISNDKLLKSVVTNDVNKPAVNINNRIEENSNTSKSVINQTVNNSNKNNLIPNLSNSAKKTVTELQNKEPVVVNSPPLNKSWASLFNNNDIPALSENRQTVKQLETSQACKPFAVVSPISSAQGERLETISQQMKNISTKQMNNKALQSSKSACSKFLDDPNSYRLGEFFTKYTIDNRTVSLLPRGLTNRSNYCYVNSILQALLACPPFYNLIRALPQQYMKSGDEKSASPIVRSMVDLIDEFTPLPPGARVGRREKNIASTSTSKEREGFEMVNCGPALEPSCVYRSLHAVRSDTFSLEGRQEDAEEFLGCLLNGLNDEMLELIKLADDGTINKTVEMNNSQMNGNSQDHGDEDEWKVMGPKNKGSVTRTADFGRSPISDIFRGQLRSRVQRSGDQSTDNVQPFFTLQLDIEKASSVKEALELLVGRDRLEGVVCSKTQQAIEAWQQVTLEQLPLVLILHLKCFHYEQDACSKIIKSVEFPVDLKIDAKLLSSKIKYTAKQKQYKLFAVVYHDGKEASKGHYITDAYHVGYNCWVRYDDSSVKGVTEPQVLHPRAPRMPYLLYYRRCDTIGNQGTQISKKD